MKITTSASCSRLLWATTPSATKLWVPRDGGVERRLGAARGDLDHLVPVDVGRGDVGQLLRTDDGGDGGQAVAGEPAGTLLAAEEVAAAVALPQPGRDLALGDAGPAGGLLDPGRDRPRH